MHVYGTRDLERLLNIPVSSVRSLIRAGHVRPHKGPRGRLQFSFQDLIILRTARTLSGANVSARRLNRCLRELRKALPASMPLSGLSISAIGDQVAVREGRQHWETESGQYLLALEVVVEAGEVQLISRATPVIRGDAASDDGADSASDAAGEGGYGGSAQYERAHDLESNDPAAAIAAYERCLAANRGHVDARVNCGRLLHIAGRLADAERMYRDADSADSTLLFNLAVLLEDLGREAEAMQVYREALDVDPGLADAHFNLARLHQLAGNERDSLRHLLAYKRASD